MKSVLFAIVAVIAFLQYQIWFGSGGLNTVWQMKYNIKMQQQQNKQAIQRNQVLEAEIKDLKTGDQAVEERARNELGMVKQGEIFYQVVKH